MKKLLFQGVCQTLILMVALFLFSASLLMYVFTDMKELEKADPDTFAALEAIQLTIQAIPNGQNGTGNTQTESEKTTVRITADQTAGAPTLQQQIMQLLLERPDVTGFFYAGLFGLMIVTMIPEVLPWQKCEKKKRLRFLVCAGSYLGCGVPFLFMGATEWSILIMNIVYCLGLLARMGVSLTGRHRVRNIAPDLILFLLIAVNFIQFPTHSFFVLAMIALRSLKQILKLSFSQIRLDVLRKVIRKSYATEILFGMLLLMIAFSILLGTMDENMTSFGDALWFCFATVTTIGYGDVTSSSLVGRVLAVILGVYGIVVVALITSIIVNFYNETKADPDPEQEPESASEQENAPDQKSPALPEKT